MTDNKEFQVHILNDDGINKAGDIAQVFDNALTALSNLCPAGREFAIVKTKMEEACFFAKKSMAQDPVNGKDHAQAA